MLDTYCLSEKNMRRWSLPPVEWRNCLCCAASLVNIFTSFFPECLSNDCQVPVTQMTNLNKLATIFRVSVADCLFERNSIFLTPRGDGWNFGLCNLIFEHHIKQTVKFAYSHTTCGFGTAVVCISKIGWFVAQPNRHELIVNPLRVTALKIKS